MKKFNVTVNGTVYEVEVNEVGGAAPVAAGAETVKCPMPGKILSVAVTAGQAVKKGDLLCILEAMKMQNEIYAPHDATVAEVRVAANQTVATGDALVVLG